MSQKSRGKLVSYLAPTGFCRYPRLRKVIHDNGFEFTGYEFQEMCSSYGVKLQLKTVTTLRSNSVAERMHLTMGYMLRTTGFEGEEWPQKLNVALKSVAWAICYTISRISGYTSGKLVFSTDMIMQIKVIADWEAIKKKKQVFSLKSN